MRKKYLSENNSIKSRGYNFKWGQVHRHFSKIILFGSQARGKATQESNVDIVIISEDFRDKDIFERAILTKDAEIKAIKKFLVPLDIITLTPEEFESESSLIAEYAKNGEVVYGG